MKRAILKIPEGLELSQLTQEQQAAIQSVFTEFVMPMPGTIPFNGHIIIDSIAGDNYDPETMQGLSLPFELLDLWQWDGVGELIRLEESWGDIIDYFPAGVFNIPHGFAGWPNV